MESPSNELLILTIKKNQLMEPVTEAQPKKAKPSCPPVSQGENFIVEKTDEGKWTLASCLSSTASAKSLVTKLGVRAASPAAPAWFR